MHKNRILLTHVLGRPVHVTTRRQRGRSRLAYTLYKTVRFGLQPHLCPLSSSNSVLLVSQPLFAMSDSRIRLADISALTLYNGEPTLSRRGQPIPQLVCKGKPCKLFQPDAIRCVNIGGEGANVDWKVRVHDITMRSLEATLIATSNSVKRTYPSLCVLVVFKCPVRGGRVQETLTS